MVTGGPDDLGLYTVGQFQCVCIAVAIYPNPVTPNWTQAWLAHASHPGHSVIQTIVDTLIVANHNQAYVVIACKPGGEWLSRISEKFKTAADANRVSVAPAQIWLYSTTNNATFSFGIRRGLSMRITGWTTSQEWNLRTGCLIRAMDWEHILGARWVPN
jgi:hypothetical protein